VSAAVASNTSGKSRFLDMVYLLLDDDPAAAKEGLSPPRFSAKAE
jgi:hypothetical protein